MRHLGDHGMIAIAPFIGQPDGLTDLYAKACAKMMAQISRHRDQVVMYSGGTNKKCRHGVENDRQERGTNVTRRRSSSCRRNRRLRYRRSYRFPLQILRATVFVSAKVW